MFVCVVVSRRTCVERRRQWCESAGATFVVLDMSLANPFWWKAVNVKFDFAAKVRFVDFLLIFCMDVRAHRARCTGCGWWQCEKHTLCKFVVHVEVFGMFPAPLIF